MPKPKNKVLFVLNELKNHLPFSIFGVVLGILMMGILTFIAIISETQHLLKPAAEELFHIFHPAHVLLSATATTAMFWKHERNVVKAIIVGILGSILVCGISDILFPFVGGIVLGQKMSIHICFFEHYGVLLPFLIVGLLSGFTLGSSTMYSTEYSHSMHVFTSSSASILYLIGFGLEDWIHYIGGVFILTIIAVMIPCCLSDIVFPLTCSHKECGCDEADNDK